MPTTWSVGSTDYFSSTCPVCSRRSLGKNQACGVLQGSTGFLQGLKDFRKILYGFCTGQG